METFKVGENTSLEQIGEHIKALYTPEGWEKMNLYLDQMAANPRLAILYLMHNLQTVVMHMKELDKLMSDALRPVELIERLLGARHGEQPARSTSNLEDGPAGG